MLQCRNVRRVEGGSSRGEYLHHPQNRTLCLDGHNHRRTQSQALHSEPYPGIFFGVFTDHDLSALNAFSSQAGLRVGPSANVRSFSCTDSTDGSTSVTESNGSAVGIRQRTNPVYLRF